MQRDQAIGSRSTKLPAHVFALLSIVRNAEIIVYQQRAIKLWQASNCIRSFLRMQIILDFVTGFDSPVVNSFE